MALTSAILGTELDAEVTNTTSEAAARTAWAKAWADYFYNATSNAVAVTGGSLATAQAAMDSGMSGLSSTGAAAIQAGISAFWASIATTPGAVFTGATVITVPGTLSGIAAALASVFAANAMPGVTKTQALTDIAASLHTNGGLGGTATFPGPVVAPIL